ncbi:hypothetical protein BC830DRAFT_1120807 [Chytriomyces sp. MP71]|nr:hypothetical protein BC830DRAFT_1120807 [Chytriomyces sp. MP71]
MAHFFDSVASVLNPRNPSSSVIVSLVSGQETRWDLVAQALRSNLHLSTDDSPFPFQESDWKGYVVKRNMHGKSFKNEATKKRMVDDMKSFGFRFVRSDPQAQAAAHESALAALAATGLGKLSLVQDKKKQKEQERQLSTACPDAVTSADPISTDYTVRTRTSVISTHLAGTPTDTSITTATTTSSTLPKTKALLNSLPLPSPLACPFCAKPFSTPRAYKQHVLQIHILQQRGPDWTPDAPRTLPCRGWPRSNTPACSKRFAHADARWQHEVIKHSRLDAGEDAPILQAAVPDAAAPGVEPFLAITDEPTEDAEYVPCDVCGQAVARRAWGMALHLETLKPVVGLDMRCPRDCGVRGFIERRALWQHYMFCRLKGLPDGAGEEEEEEEVVVVEKEEGN